jgi:cutinase
MAVGATYLTFLGALLLLLSTTSDLVTAKCADIHVVFARCSGEEQGFGICVTPFLSAITSNLAGMRITSHAVEYRALWDQSTAGPGATNMTKEVVSVAGACPIGIKTILGTSSTIPMTLASRIKAIVTFGDPLKLLGRIIKVASATYGSKAVEFCNLGDPV